MPCWRFQALYKIREPFTIFTSDSLEIQVIRDNNNFKKQALRPTNKYKKATQTHTDNDNEPAETTSSGN